MINLGIIFGGVGPEHEASLYSARALIDHFNPLKYQLSLYGIRKDGTWVVGSDAWEELFQYSDKHMLPSGLRQYEARFEVSGNNYFRAYPPPRAFAHLDCIFNIVHGPMGEDGSLQGFLSFFEKPFVGCSLGTAKIAYDKVLAKNWLAADLKVPTADWLFFPPNKSALAIADEVINHFGEAELIVKPNACGSSLGVSYVCEPSQLLPAITEARTFDKNILIEEYITNIEIFVGVIGVYPELIIGKPMYDSSIGGKKYATYGNKYISYGGSNSFLSTLKGVSAVDKIESKAKQLAADIYESIGCSGLARVDFLYDLKKDRLLFSEVNTTPSIAPSNAVPMGILAETGYSYPDFLDTLVQNAMKSSCLMNLHWVKTRSTSENSFNACTPLLLS